MDLVQTSKLIIIFLFIFSRFYRPSVQLNDSVSLSSTVGDTGSRKKPNTETSQPNPQIINVTLPFAERADIGIENNSLENFGSSSIKAEEPVPRNMSQSLNLSFGEQDASEIHSPQAETLLHTDLNAQMFKTNQVFQSEFTDPNSPNNATRSNSRPPSRPNSRPQTREGKPLGNKIHDIKNLRDQHQFLSHNTTRSSSPTQLNMVGEALFSKQPSQKFSKSTSFREDLNEIKKGLRSFDLTETNNPDDVPLQQDQQKQLEEVIETIYSNIAKNGIVPENWNLIKIAIPKLKRSIEEKGTSTEDLEDEMSKELYELPIYSNQENILVTRSYKPTPELMTFEEQLTLSPNPVYLLFQKYHSYLSDIQKDRLFYSSLLSTVFGANRRRIARNENDHSSSTFPPIDPVLLNRNRKHIIHAAHQILSLSKRLSEESSSLLPIINAVETLVDDSVQIVKTMRKTNESKIQKEVPSQKYLINSLSDLYRLTGTVEGKEISINLRIMELRSFYESIQSVGSKELGILLQESAELNEAYNIFIETQGRMVKPSTIHFSIVLRSFSFIAGNS